MTYKNYNDYELMYLISENNEDAYQTVFDKYQPLILKEAIKYFFFAQKLGISKEDLIEEGKIGLYKAIKQYNNDVEFFTFASLCIKRSILKIIAKNTTTKEKIVSEAINIDDNNDNFLYYKTQKDEDFVQIIIDRDFESKIIEFKNELNMTDSLIFELKYNGFSYKEISILMDIKTKTVDNRLLNIRNKLKKYLKEIK